VFQDREAGERSGEFWDADSADVLARSERIHAPSFDPQTACAAATFDDHFVQQPDLAVELQVAGAIGGACGTLCASI
jgi:hypothetical protein